MPVCTWCGIESKSDLVCDWCKRPLALSAMRRPQGGKSAVDLLKDSDDDGGGWSKRTILAVAVVSVLVIAVFIWALAGRSSEPSTSAASQDFVAQRESAMKPAAAGAPAAAPAAAARPAFIPAPAQETRAVRLNTGEGGDSARGIPVPLAAQIWLDPNEYAASTGPAVRLTGGILKSIGGRKGLAVGRVSISNSTDTDVVDFRLEAMVNGRSYTLQPFEGSLDKPRNLGSKLIQAGEKLTVPVSVVGYSGGKKPTIVPARITLNAWLASGPSVVKDELLTP